jgi:D-lyxose ketol-isomerase
VQLLAANSSRRYLLVQNNDTAGVLRVTVDGNAAAAGEGFRLQPGESIEFPTVAPSSAINAIMETASAVVDNVEFVEG